MHTFINNKVMRLLALVTMFIIGGANAQTMSTAKSETEKLMNAALPFAEQMLNKHGEFHPYGHALDAQGKIVSVAGAPGDEPPRSAEVIQLLKEGFIHGAKSGKYRATALVYDVRVPIPSAGIKSDAIAISLNHKDNYSVIVYLPYKLEGKKLVTGDLFVTRGENDIFPK